MIPPLTIEAKYDRLRRTSTKTPRGRFMAEWAIGPQHQCWLWKGGRNHGGYGYLNCNGMHLLAHRIMWELTHNKIIPQGMYICHTCDNRLCLNPNHLFLGTPQDNAIDRRLKMIA